MDSKRIKAVRYHRQLRLTPVYTQRADAVRVNKSIHPRKGVAPLILRVGREGKIVVLDLRVYPFPRTRGIRNNPLFIPHRLT